MQRFGDHPIPADVTGEVLFSGPGEQVVRLRVAVIGPGGASRRVLAEVEKRFAVVDCQPQALPRLGGKGLEEAEGGQRAIKVVSLRRQVASSA
jgi:hypothetical protein